MLYTWGQKDRAPLKAVWEFHPLKNIVTIVCYYWLGSETKIHAKMRNLLFAPPIYKFTTLNGNVSQMLEYLNYGKLNNRLFGQWSFRTLNLAISRMQEFTTNEPIDVVVSMR